MESDSPGPSLINTAIEQWRTIGSCLAVREEREGGRTLTTAVHVA